MSARLAGAFVLSLVLMISGCVTQRSAPRPPVAPPPPVDRLLAHLSGAWQATEREASHTQLTFQPDGRLIFEGGLTSYNPAFWSLDKTAQTLTLHFPEATNSALDIFRLNLGDGVLAFHRAEKEVVYRFTEDTLTLNVAGWLFSKPQHPVPAAAPEAEPTLK